jgi:hypothetical protein
MTIKERLKAEETKIGKFLKKWLSGFLLLCSALGAANEYLAVLPPDFVPTWLKTAIVVSGVISFIAGKLTVKKPI